MFLATLNFSDADQKRVLRHLQKCMLQEIAYIAKFQALIEQGPYYICTVCHRLLYRKSVVTLNLMAYELRDIITDILSFNNEKYICKTCHNKLRKNKKPESVLLSCNTAPVVINNNLKNRNCFSRQVGILRIKGINSETVS